MRDRSAAAVRPGLSCTTILWHAVRSFFEEGGKRLYRSGLRVQAKLAGAYPPGLILTPRRGASDGLYDDGHARATIGGLRLRSAGAFPGRAAGNLRVRSTVRLGQERSRAAPTA